MCCMFADEVVRVFDGNASMKKRQYRTITVPRNAPAHVLLVCIPVTYQLVPSLALTLPRSLTHPPTDPFISPLGSVSPVHQSS